MTKANKTAPAPGEAPGLRRSTKIFLMLVLLPILIFSMGEGCTMDKASDVEVASKDTANFIGEIADILPNEITALGYSAQMQAHQDGWLIATKNTSTYTYNVNISGKGKGKSIVYSAYRGKLIEMRFTESTFSVGMIRSRQYTFYGKYIYNKEEKECRIRVQHSPVDYDNYCNIEITFNYQ